MVVSKDGLRWEGTYQRMKMYQAVWVRAHPNWRVQRETRTFLLHGACLLAAMLRFECGACCVLK